MLGSFRGYVGAYAAATRVPSRRPARNALRNEWREILAGWQNNLRAARLIDGPPLAAPLAERSDPRFRGSFLKISR
jgi:hypothetical protein